MNMKTVVVGMGLVWSMGALAATPFTHWQLPGGTEVWLAETHQLPMVDVSVSFPAGSAFDPADKPGLAGLTQRMLDQGAAGMTDVQIADRPADVGAQLGTEIDPDRVSVTLRSLSQPDKENAAVDILAGVLNQPTFDAKVMEREKARLEEALRQEDAEPQMMAAVAFQNAVFAGHPYAHRTSGDVSDVARLQAVDVRQFWQTHYSRNHAVVALVGDLTHDQANALAEKLVAHLPATGAPTAIPPVSMLSGAVLKQISFPAQQSQILIGQPGVKRGDPDYFALYVGNYVLGGGGFDSRLMKEVREKRGLAYSVYSYFMPMQQAGAFQIGLQTRTNETANALQVVRQTLRDFLQHGVTQDELTQAKNSIVGGFPLRIDSNRKQLEYLSMIAFYHLPADYLEEFPQKVQQVTAQQIHDAFQRHIDPDHMATVVVGAAPPIK